jgi:hypothetical protein
VITKTNTKNFIQYQQTGRKSGLFFYRLVHHRPTTLRSDKPPDRPISLQSHHQ